MNKFMEILENILLPIADKLNNNRYLTALCDGFMVALPLIIFGILVIRGIGYNLTEHYGGEAIYGGVVAVASFLIFTPQEFEGVSGVIPTAILGAEGMFLGIFTAFISAELYRFFVNKEWM